MTELRAWLHGASFGQGAPEQPPGLAQRFRPLVGPFAPLVVDVTGPDDLLAPARDGLPEGAAAPEAVAVRLRRRGVELEWGPARNLHDLGHFLHLCRERGRSSVEIVRADPTLLPELKLGSWFNVGWRGRLALRAAQRLVRAGSIARLDRRVGGIAGDAAFWSGVRSVATPPEWRRFTRSSYAVLVYHRLTNGSEGSGDRFDVESTRFFAQQRALGLLGFNAVDGAQIAAFHSDHSSSLPGRAYAITFDDGLRDCLEALRAISSLGPQLFVCTQETGNRPDWANGAETLSWDELADLAHAGVLVGSHARHHRRLEMLPAPELADEVEGSLADLRRSGVSSLALLAYPHGAHDARVRAAAIAAGYSAAYTTEKGRNGAGVDRYCLRRIAVHESDSSLAVVWKAVTGEPPPRLLARRRRKAFGARDVAA